MHPPANCNNVYPLSFFTLSSTNSLPLSILFSSSSSSRFCLSFSNLNRFVSFEQRSRASGTRILSSSSSFLLSSRSQRRDNIRGNVHRFAINYPAACVCARDRCVPRLHRRRPANANGSPKVIIASQRARRNTWPLIIEMSAYLAHRWNRVSRAAVSAYTARVPLHVSPEWGFQIVFRRIHPENHRFWLQSGGGGRCLCSLGKWVVTLQRLKLIRKRVWWSCPYCLDS